MADLRNWWRIHRPTTRRLAQLYAALLYNASLKGFIDGSLYTGSTKAVCVPGLNCYSCPGAVGACPLGSLQNALASSGHTAGWYVFGLFLLFGIPLGRTICGWICPMGLIQELLHRIPTPKIRKSRITRALSWLKYVVLGVFATAIPLMFGLANNIALPAFCKYICPAGTLEGAIALLASPNNGGMFAQLGILFTRKFVILIIIGLACIFCYRSFCRFLCPLGAIYSLFNKFCLVGVKVDENKCNHCGACVRHCEMDIRHVGDHECISCGKCMSTCQQGAISIKCGKWTLKGPDTGKNADPEPVRAKRKRNGRIVWGVLLAILVFALIYYNFIDVPKDADAQEKDQAQIEMMAGAETESDFSSSAPVGSEVGQQLEDFTCTLFDGNTFKLSDYRGQIVFINQWATYCTPCINELPFFETLQEEHPEITVLAVHNSFEANPKAADYVEEMGWGEWKIHWTIDTQDNKILEKINGDNAMPRTVVLNKKGEVVFNEQRSVTLAGLEQLLEMAEEN